MKIIHFLFDHTVPFIILLVAISILFIPSQHLAGKEDAEQSKPTIHVRMNVAHRGAS
jgi:hypothetical protein